ncbi:hypothetical protein SSCG_01082 [Streptomyces clavuligerus]|nr:hypothetical protein SSCG_01082 [Streptomyces clavuligerus]
MRSDGRDLMAATGEPPRARSGVPAPPDPIALKAGPRARDRSGPATPGPPDRTAADRRGARGC